MKRLAVMALVIAMGVGTARAGVVVEEQQTVDRGAGAPSTHQITVMLQDKKHKSVIDDGKQTMIINLEDGTRTMYNEARKVYFQSPFPPAMPVAHAGPSPLSFKKTGGHEKIAGYDCDDYTGRGAMGPNEMTVSGCFSRSAPGAADFAAFQKAITDKVKGTALAMMADTPPGVPLKIDTTVKPAAAASADKDKPAETRPMLTTHMIVSKVTAKNLPADTFQPPKDYTKQEMPMMRPMGPGTMGKPAAPAPSSKNVPE